MKVKLKVVVECGRVIIFRSKLGCTLKLLNQINTDFTLCINFNKDFCVVVLFSYCRDSMVVGPRMC